MNNNNHRIYTTSVASVYPHYVTKKQSEKSKRVVIVGSDWPKHPQNRSQNQRFSSDFRSNILLDEPLN